MIIVVFALLMCAINKLTPAKQVLSPIIFQPIFFEAVPVVQGKRVYREERPIIEADTLLRRPTSQGTEINFPIRKKDSEIPVLSAQKVDFPSSKGLKMNLTQNPVDERLVLAVLQQSTSEQEESEIAETEEVPTNELGLDESTYNDTLSSQVCLIKDGFIDFQGNCSRLLSDLACESDKYWLILIHQELAECVERPCPIGELLYKDKCYSTSDDSMCGISEILYVDFAGHVYCDCEQGFIFDGYQCVAEHRQGSCPTGFYLEKSNGILCVSNPCSFDDLVRNPADGKCYQKTFEGPCNSEIQHNLALNFNTDNFTATCSLISTRNIFEAPTSKSCPLGSKRNFMNECKETFTSFALPSQFTARYSVCPPMHIMYPNGACKKVNKML